MGLMVGVGTNVEPLVEGRVRLAPPAAGAQVMLFDGTDLSRSVRATTDETGYFALPIEGLSPAARPERFYPGQNYPNRFNPSTIIPFFRANGLPAEHPAQAGAGRRTGRLGRVKPLFLPDTPRRLPPQRRFPGTTHL